MQALSPALPLLLSFYSPQYYYRYYQKAVTSMGTTPERERSEHDVLILHRGCTPFCYSLVGTLALPAPAEISLNSESLQGPGPLNMFTRRVAISNILELTLINGESGWCRLALKRAKLHQCLGFKLIPKNNSPQVCFFSRVCFESRLLPAGWLLATLQLQQIPKWPKHQGYEFIKVI